MITNNYQCAQVMTVQTNTLKLNGERSSEIVHPVTVTSKNGSRSAGSALQDRVQIFGTTITQIDALTKALKGLVIPGTSGIIPHYYRPDGDY